MAWQVPTWPERLQATQGPWQATLQQVPSLQKLERQSALLRHAAAAPFLPQLAADTSQECPELHCSSNVQLWTQAPIAESQL
jgi:hypothetical protein